MITLTTCSNPAEAELLHSLLMEHGIMKQIDESQVGKTAADLAA